MGRVSKSLRFEVLARDGFRCRYCGGEAPRVKLEVDHVVPVYRGGKDTLTNLVAACEDCNAGKSDRALLPVGDGFNLTPDRRPSRLKRMREAARAAEVDPDIHELDTGEIDELDELDDDSQLALIWCTSHRCYESHYIPLDIIGSGAIITRKRKLRGRR